MTCRTSAPSNLRLHGLARVAEEVVAVAAADADAD